MAIITPPLGGQLFGSSGFRVLFGSGDPNDSSTDSSAGDLAAASIGSTYSRLDGPDSTHCLYVKTGAVSVSAPTGVWTNK